MYLKSITIVLYYGVYLFSVVGQPLPDKHENNNQETELEAIGTTISHEDAEVTTKQQSDVDTSSIAENYTDITETITQPQVDEKPISIGESHDSVIDIHEDSKLNNELFNTDINIEDVTKPFAQHRSDVDTSSIAENYTDFTETITQPQLNLEATSSTENYEHFAEIDERLKGIYVEDEEPKTSNTVITLYDCEDNDIPKPAIKKLFNQKTASTSESLLNQYVKEFESQDENGDGILTASELHNYYKNTNYNFSVEDWQKVINVNDIDGSHNIDFFEYLVMKDSTSDHQEIINKFISMDKDKNAFVDSEELKIYLKTNIGEFSDEAIEIILNEFDKNKDKLISINEYKNYHSSKFNF